MPTHVPNAASVFNERGLPRPPLPSVPDRVRQAPLPAVPNVVQQAPPLPPLPPVPDRVRQAQLSPVPVQPVQAPPLPPRDDVVQPVQAPQPQGLPQSSGWGWKGYTGLYVSAMATTGLFGVGTVLAVQGAVKGAKGLYGWATAPSEKE